MLIVRPDFARRIDLPGAGPCPRPIDLDRNRIALTELVSLRVYSFARDMVIDGEAEGDEVFVTLMRGRAQIAVTAADAAVRDFTLDTDGGVRTVYLPPHSAYRLTATTDCDIAYARVQPGGSALPPPDGFAPDGGALTVAAHATAMQLDLARRTAGETLLLGGGDSGPPERFIHVRSDDGGVATLDDERLGDWDAAVLVAGEAATLTIDNGTLDILTITASPR